MKILISLFTLLFSASVLAGNHAPKMGVGLAAEYFLYGKTVVDKDSKDEAEDSADKGKFAPGVQFSVSDVRTGGIGYMLDVLALGHFRDNKAIQGNIEASGTYGVNKQVFGLVGVRALLTKTLEKKDDDKKIIFNTGDDELVSDSFGYGAHVGVGFQANKNMAVVVKGSYDFLSISDDDDNDKDDDKEKERRAGVRLALLWTF